ncbi:MAG: hypothetical protein AAF630_18295, partial [Cyanobacteria bacterium P01_C01_bin.38]
FFSYKHCFLYIDAFLTIGKLVVTDILHHSQQPKRNPVSCRLDNEIIVFSRQETGFLTLVQDVSLTECK